MKRNRTGFFHFYKTKKRKAETAVCVCFAGGLGKAELTRSGAVTAPRRAPPLEPHSASELQTARAQAVPVSIRAIYCCSLRASVSKPCPQVAENLRELIGCYT